MLDTPNTSTHTPCWKHEPRAFERITRIIENLLSGAITTATRPHSIKTLTRGSGLLHYLAYCPRHRFQNQAFEFARKLLQGRLQTNSDITQVDPGSVLLNPCLNINEDIDPAKLRYGNPESVCEELIQSMETPLHMAVNARNRNMVWLLLQYGADAEKLGARSMLTPYGLAKRLQGWENIVAVIEKYQGKGLMQGNCLSWSWWSEFRNLTWAEGSKLQAEWIAQMERSKDNDGV
jgi:hypothetical protein